MKPAAAKEKSRSSGHARSYLQTRIRASRLQNAARILAFIELSRRLHQAYRQAYDKSASGQLLPQNPSTGINVSSLGPAPLPNELAHCDPTVQSAIKDISQNTNRTRDEWGFRIDRDPNTGVISIGPLQEGP